MAAADPASSSWKACRAQIALCSSLRVDLNGTTVQVCDIIRAMPHWLDELVVTSHWFSPICLAILAVALTWPESENTFWKRQPKLKKSTAISGDKKAGVNQIMMWSDIAWLDINRTDRSLIYGIDPNAQQATPFGTAKYLWNQSEIIQMTSSRSSCVDERLGQHHSSQSALVAVPVEVKRAPCVAALASCAESATDANTPVHWNVRADSRKLSLSQVVKRAERQCVAKSFCLPLPVIFLIKVSGQSFVSSIWNVCDWKERLLLSVNWSWSAV